jgi:hypothetical protein
MQLCEAERTSSVSGTFEGVGRKWVRRCEGDLADLRDRARGEGRGEPPEAEGRALLAVVELVLGEAAIERRRVHVEDLRRALAVPPGRA